MAGTYNRREIWARRKRMAQHCGNPYRTNWRKRWYELTGTTPGDDLERAVSKACRGAAIPANT